MNLPSNPSNRGLKEIDVSKKINVGRVKKTLAFERSSMNGRPGELPNIHKDRYALADKENRSLALERINSNSHNDVAKHNLMMDLRKSANIEPSRACYAEKEPMKLNPILEPMMRESKHEEENAPEKISNFNEPEVNKVASEAVNVKEQCNQIVREYVLDIMQTLKIKDVTSCIYL